MLVGGALRNVYRRQRMVPGLVAVGDAVSTTTPTAGRGVAMASMQVTAMLGLLDAGAEPMRVAEPFGAWCDEQMQPWVADHIANDDVAVERWQGADLDLSRPLTSLAIHGAAEVDPRIHEHSGPFMSMVALPTSLAPAEPWARAVYELRLATVVQRGSDPRRAGGGRRERAGGRGPDPVGGPGHRHRASVATSCGRQAKTPAGNAPRGQGTGDQRPPELGQASRPFDAEGAPGGDAEDVRSTASTLTSQLDAGVGEASRRRPVTRGRPASLGVGPLLVGPAAGGLGGTAR